MVSPETGFNHLPVLQEEVVAWLVPALRRFPLLVDCTVGGGGHSAALMAEVPELELLGLDQDPEALAAAEGRLSPFGNRVLLRRGNFRDLSSHLESAGHEKAGAILYDLGVSSHQLDSPHRGFGYRVDAPLDMRMDPSSNTAAVDIVNGYSEAQLARVLTMYGEERFARSVAAAIVRRRGKRPFETTTDLAEVVKSAIPAAARRRGPHPARRTFQALRLETNRELEALQSSLDTAIPRIVPLGRLAVISYHSLEDRIVKRKFAGLARGCTCPPDFPVCVCGRNAELRVLTRKAVRPGAEERTLNPRSDSARLRVVEKVSPGQAA